MTQVISVMLSAGYYIVCLSVIVRAVLMLAAYLKSSPEGQKKAGKSLLMSAAAEFTWCALVRLSFNVSYVELIPLVLSVLGLSMLRRIAPFEKVGSQHVYSLLSSIFPKKQVSLARMTAYHLF